MITHMSRRPRDTTPQRRLVDLLRVDVDKAIAGNARAKQRVATIVAANPNSIRATYVTYNLGIKRTNWIDTHVESASRARAGGAFQFDAWLTRSSKSEPLTP